MNSYRSLERPDTNQRGINMVDLMMWLVIAAMLLAAALQAIGYYQKAAYVYQMQSDLSGAGAAVVSASSMQDGKIDQTAANTGSAEAKWSKDIVHSVELATSGSIPYLRASHPSITDRDAIYLFKSCGNFQAGVNMVPKGGSPDLTACGVTAGGGGGGGGTVVTGPSFNTLTWTAKTAEGNASWLSFAATSDGKTMISTKGTNSAVRRSTDGGATWSDMTTVPAGAYNALAMSTDGKNIVIGNQNGTLYFSQNSGVTFNPTTAGNAGAGVGGWYTAASSDDGKVIVAGDYNNALYVSKDSGSTWTKQVTPNASGVPSIGTWVSSYVSSDGTKIFVGAKDGYIYKSSGNGTWTKVAPTGTASGEYWALTGSGDGNTLYAGKMDGKVWKSTDAGATWSELTNTQIAKWRSLAVSDDGTKLAGGTFSLGLYVSKDAGATWNIASGLPADGPFYSIAMSVDGTVMVTGKSNEKLYIGNYS